MTNTNTLPNHINLDALQQAASWIQRADGLIIAAGAGMGVDSGLPDFRGKEGFWRAYPALAQLNIDFEDIANSELFFNNPELAWGFYGHRWRLYQQAQTRNGFQILKKWLSRKKEGGWVYTSNVDGQFQAAGFDAQKIVECHGSLFQLQCSTPCHQSTWTAAGFQPQVDMAQCRLSNALPQCPHCGETARPNILLFNDHSWVNKAEEATRQFESWLPWLQKPVVIELGAGTHVPSIRNLSARLAQHHHCPLIRINPDDCTTPYPQSIGLQGGALSVLTAIDALL